MIEEQPVSDTSGSDQTAAGDVVMSVRDLLDLLEEKVAKDEPDHLQAFNEIFNEHSLAAYGIDINAGELCRLDAAIMLHTYMREVVGIPDLEDISGAAVLKDLYDCRKCVNHIAQVYLRGLIRPVSYPLPDGKVITVFDGRGNMKKSALCT